MTLLFMDGFDHYTAAQGTRKWFSGSTKVGAGRFGTGQSAYQNGQFTGGTGSPMITNSFGNQQTLYIGFALYLEDYPHSDYIWYFKDGTQYQVELRMNGIGQLYFSRAGTPIGSPSVGSLVLGTWYYIECKVYVHPSAGICEARVAETVWVSNTGVNTQYSTNAWINNIYNDTIINNPGRMYDDLWICNDAGSINNGYLGDCRIETLYPSGAGSLSEWTPSAGSNSACVDESPANDDTDYVSTATVDNKDLYAFTNLTTTAGLIRAIQSVITARLGNAGARTISAIALTDGNNTEGPNIPVLAASYLCYSGLQELNPSTGLPWTMAEVNGSEFGVRVVS